MVRPPSWSAEPSASCTPDGPAPELTEEATNQASEADSAQVQSFVTRPVLAPPQIEFTDGTTADKRTGENEYYFLSSSSYGGEPVLTYYRDLWRRGRPRSCGLSRHHDHRPRHHAAGLVLPHTQGPQRSRRAGRRLSARLPYPGGRHRHWWGRLEWSAIDHAPGRASPPRDCP